MPGVHTQILVLCALLHKSSPLLNILLQSSHDLTSVYLSPMPLSPTAKVELDGIDRNPVSVSVQRANIQKTLEFLRHDGVLLHTDAFRGGGQWEESDVCVCV